MPRRREVPKREILPDPKFGNVELSKFMNVIMEGGKKAVAERIIYGALELIEKKHPEGRSGSSCCHQQRQAHGGSEVPPRGGANYQVPVEVRPSVVWLCPCAGSRKPPASVARSPWLNAWPTSCWKPPKAVAALKRRDEVHRMAEANKAFSHFRF
jgi:small subunit ribosomal protein S7